MTSSDIAPMPWVSAQRTKLACAAAPETIPPADHVRPR